jgi:outer membrane lipoprotein-sorting protein
MKRVVWIAFALLLVLSLVLAACGQPISAEEIVAKMRETLEATQDAHAVVNASVNAQGVEISATAEIWEGAPNKVRVQILQSSDPDLAGVLAVSDGQQAWYYEPAKNRVQVAPAGQIEMPLPQQLLGSMQEAIQQVLEASNVELAGEETVLGREAYKLVLSPKEGTTQELYPGNGTATLWVDKEQWFVLKAAYQADAFGQGSMEVQSFELNPGLADDLFRFTPPEGTELEEVHIEVPEPLTLDQAKAQALFQLLVPEYVPEGATLVEVFKMGSDIYLEYNQPPDNSFSIVQSIATGGSSPVGGPAKQIMIRGHDATLVTDEQETKAFLRWIENGVLIAIAGNISPDEAIKVAESLK